ncbi:hypothetical protein ACFLYQ_06880 [Chloroflexota bacterium]
MVTEKDTPLLQYITENRAIISAVRNQTTMWLLGYILLNSPVSQDELDDSLELDDKRELYHSAGQLIESGLVQQRADGLFDITRSGAHLGRTIGIAQEADTNRDKQTISCDVFQIQNTHIAQATKESKQALIEQLVYKPQLHGELEGYHYGFVECKAIEEEIIYGYFTQEYWDHSLKYGDELERQEQWDTRNVNLLFIWPLKSQVFILQDTRFFGSSLSMTTAKSRIVMLLSLLVDHCQIEHSGSFGLSPFERTMSNDEMLEVLTREEVISKVDVGLEKVGDSLQGAFPVFNPREDWNDVLRQIFNEYEMPNLRSAVFTAKKMGTLSKSMITKAFAMAGQVKNIDIGKGKNKRTITRKVPIHVGQATVSEPAKDNEILGIIGFLQSRIGMQFTDLPIEMPSQESQMKFQI